MSCILSFTNKAAIAIPAEEDFHIYSEEEFNSIALTWDTVTAEHFHLNSKMLSSIRNSTGGDMKFYFILFRNEKGENIGAAYFQLVSFDHRHYKNFFRKNSILKWFEQKIIDNRFRLLVCGSLFSIEGAGYCFKQNFSNELATRLNEATNALAKKIRASALIIKDIPDSETQFFNPLGLNKYEGDKTMQMEISPSWKSLSDYEQSLKHKYAQRFRSIRKKLSGISIQELSEEEIEDYSDKLFLLLDDIVEKQTIRLGRVNRNYFSELKKVYGYRMKLFGFYKQDELIAFAIHRIHDKEYEIHFVGFEEIENRIHNIYFNILFHGIEQAIISNCTSLEMGRTAIEAKAIIGAKPRLINGFYRFYHPMATRLFTILQKHFQKKTEPKVIERHPFKTA